MDDTPIESMEAVQKALKHRVACASVNLVLNEEYHARVSIPPLSAGSRLHNALITGYRNASEILLGIILFLAEGGPTIFIWLAMIAVRVGLFRRRYVEISLRFRCRNVHPKRRKFFQNSGQLFFSSRQTKILGWSSDSSFGTP
jgi:hypothetical protein